jgi:hypothetical protein
LAIALALILRKRVMSSCGWTGNSTTFSIIWISALRPNHAYDTHIPILFYGASFRTGRYSNPVQITDIAPTICAFLRINEPSGCTGTPLRGLLQDL